MSNNIFDLNRFCKLLYSELKAQSSTILTTAITIVGVLLLYNIMSPYNLTTVNTNPSGFSFLLFVGGIWVSSSGFSYIHDKQSSYFYLTLPCSNFEKFLSRLLLTSIIYAISVLLLYTTFYWILSILSLVLFQHSYFISTPFLSSTWEMIWTYYVIQSIFLLGSIYFATHPLLKTILAVSCIGIALMIIFGMISRLFVTELFYSNPFWMSHMLNTGSTISYIFNFVFWILLAPFCWIITYFRFKEIEV